MYARGLSTRDPSEIWPLHLFLDSVAERLRPASAREAVLLPLALPEKAGRCSGILLPAPRSQPSAAGSFLKQMKRRGLAEPVLVCTDGPPDSSGRWRSAFLVCLGSGVWRTRSRNIVGKGPKRSQAEVKEALNAAYRAPSLPPARVIPAVPPTCLNGSSWRKRAIAGQPEPCWLGRGRHTAHVRRSHLRFADLEGYADIGAQAPAAR